MPIDRTANYGRGNHTIELDSEALLTLEPQRVVAAVKAIFDSPTYQPPLLPTAVFELMRVAQRPDVGRKEIVKLLETEPMLVAAVLRLAESPAYRRAEPLRTLDAAIGRLGLRTLSDLFLQASMNARVFRAPGYEEPMKKLREHSTLTAHIARIVAREAGVPDERVFMAGLLHDVGMAAAMIAITDNTRPKARPPAYTSVESAILDLHESASEVLAKTWNLPLDIRPVLSGHHYPLTNGAPDKLRAVVCVADALACGMGYGPKAEVVANSVGAAVVSLKLDEPRLEAIRRGADQAVRQLGSG